MRRRLRLYFWLGFFTFIAPLTLVFYAYHKLWPFIEKIAAPTFLIVPVDSKLGAFIEVIVYMIVVIAFTIFLGWIVQKTVLKPWSKKAEQIFSFVFPSYLFYKNFIAHTGVNDSIKWKPMVVYNGFGIQMGFVIEEKGDLCTVFIPNIPKPYEGKMAVVKQSQIEYLDITFTDAVEIIRYYGKDLINQECLKNVKEPCDTPTESI